MKAEGEPLTPVHGSSALPVSRWETRAVWVLFVLFAYFPLFLNLDILPLREWDESRQAISAYEMMKDHDLLVAHFGGGADMWSTKPPFLVWCQTALFMVLGPGELALRLPSAIAAFLTGALLLYVCSRWLRRPWLGLIGALVLYTGEGYVCMHVARSGDYDAMLTFFLFAVLVCAFRYERTGSKRAITGLFVALTLAVLTKSVQGLLMVPGAGLYLLFTGTLPRFLRERRTWLGLGGFVLAVGAFYLGRESANPGYLQAVWENELGGRYGTVLEGHRGPWDFFIERFFKYNFTYWYLLVPCGIVAGFCEKDAAMRRWTLLLTLAGATYLAIISSAGTKCEWYDAPLYPVFGGLCGIALYAVFVWFRTAGPFRHFLRPDPSPYLGLFLAFTFPYAHIVGHIYSGEEWSWEEEHFRPMRYLQTAARGQRELKADAICYEAYNANLLFYAHLLTDQGKAIKPVDKDKLRPGMRAMASEGYVKDFIESHYSYQLLDDDYGVRVYGITGPFHEHP